MVIDRTYVRDFTMALAVGLAGLALIFGLSKMGDAAGQESSWHPESHVAVPHRDIVNDKRFLQIATSDGWIQLYQDTVTGECFLASKRSGFMTWDCGDRGGGMLMLEEK